MKENWCILLIKFQASLFFFLFQIQAYLKCHKLRSAYLISVKQENIRAVQLVQHIRQMAEDGGDHVVQAICTQWLSVHHTKPRSWLTQNSRKWFPEFVEVFVSRKGKCHIVLESVMAANWKEAAWMPLFKRGEKIINFLKVPVMMQWQLTTSTSGGLFFTCFIFSVLLQLCFYFMILEISLR